MEKIPGIILLLSPIAVAFIARKRNRGLAGIFPGLLALSALIFGLAAPSMAAQFHVPLHLPPHRMVPEGEAGKEFLIGAGHSWVSAPGIKVDGAGIMYVPWKLTLEFFGRLSTGSGNNEPVTAGGVQAAIKLF